MKTGLAIHLLPAVVLVCAAPALRAQTTPTMSAFQFSDGVHPTFDATFPDTDARTVASFWKNELKSISVKVADKKEMIGQAARIPAATSDTLRILIKVEQPKGSTTAIAHIAFLTTAGFVAPDSPKRLLDGCTAWVQQRTVALQRRNTQKVLDDAQRELGRQQGRLNDLKRDRARAENGLVSTAQKSDKATQDKAAAEKQLEELNSDNSLPADSTAAAKAEKDRGRQRYKLQDRIKLLGHTIDSARKKTDKLNWSIKQNDQDQVAQQQVVDKQQAVVNDLQQKLQAIH
jgi:hypothetical protein